MSVFFSNESTIDLAAISVMGVSVKETDNPIGYFGTGLKFSIATLLRTGHEVTLFRGDEAIEFTARPKTIRGQEFLVVYMGDQELGFTTQLGKNWEVWQAYRELYCNCQDEDGHITTSLMDGEWGTVFEVSGPAIEEWHGRRGEIFLLSDPVYSSSFGNVHNGRSKYVYNRGVRAHDLSFPSLFTYNMTDGMTLTEDRTISSEYTMKSWIANTIVGCTDEEIIRTVLLASEFTFESGLDFLQAWATPSSEFLSVCESLRHNTACNDTAYKLWRRNAEVDLVYDAVPLDNFEMRQLADALVLCKRLECPIELSDFTVVSDLGEGVMACVREKKILVSKRTFDMGPRFIASTLYEEWLHAEHDKRDCTRDMQNLLFEKLLSFVERMIVMENAE